MNRNAQKTESSLLLQLPRSVYSFSDMSGNSFLMPVAVDNVVATDDTSQNTSTSEIQGSSSKVEDTTSVCQLQQPLLMRKTSVPSIQEKISMPYSESDSQVSSADYGSVGASQTRQPFPSSVNDAVNRSIYTEPQISSSTSTVPSSTAFTGIPTQLFSVPVTHSDLSYSKPDHQVTSKGIFNPGYSQESAATSITTHASSYVPVMTSLPPAFMEKNHEYYNVSASNTDYYSQPSVPRMVPTYSYSGRSVPQMSQSTTYPNLTNQSSDFNPNVMATSTTYEPIKPFWLFRDVVETKEIWYGFSNTDSDKLEMAYQQDPQSIVSVDGGRYDAVLNERVKKPVYFDAKNLEIRRCTWFYRPDSSQRFMPFPEEVSNLLENHYHSCVTSGQWQKRVNLPGIGSVILESPQLWLYYKNEVDLWPSLPDSKASPKTVKRGLPENFEIMPDENNCIDHLVFIVQGIGSFCDLRFRTVSECVDGFRDISNKLLSSHFKHEFESKQVGRVEFLPVAWHAKLHTNDKGFDRCMQNITLPSIPKLRHFTNDTLLDILLYSSPSYCQTIIDTVASELNKLYEVFLRRNPGFAGKVFVAGHSLGSLILFDILAHQKLENEITPSDELLTENKISKHGQEKDGGDTASKCSLEEVYPSIESLLESCSLEEYIELFQKEKIDLSSLPYLSNDDLKDLGLPIGPRKKLLNAVHFNVQLKSIPEGELDISELPMESSSRVQTCEIERSSSTESHCVTFPLKSSPCMSSLIYPRLHFEPAAFFALGSPISMFLAVRGYDTISEDFRFPTCQAFFHIFHPYDPVAFRIEPLIDPNFSVKPVLIPHHKGRKRMHLEIRENLSKVGFEIKQKVLETLRYTWNSLSGFAKAHTFPTAAVEAEVDKLVNQQMSESDYDTQAPSETSGEDIQIGSLNGGRRIDYVLQEKPIEALNDYIFALTSHATYWDSEDTVLMILREIYATQGIRISSQPNENRQFAQLEQFTSENFAQLSSGISHPCVFETPNIEQDLPGNISSFCKQNQSIAPIDAASMQNIHSMSNCPPVVSNISNVVPPAPVTQPVGPPPLTGFVKRSPFTK